MQITTKTFNEEVISPNTYQVIKLTDEMKAKYKLDEYNELIISGRLCDFKIAKEYAKKCKAVLPDRTEGINIWNLIHNSGWTKFFSFWTRERANRYTVYSIISDSYIESLPSGSLSCICLR